MALTIRLTVLSDHPEGCMKTGEKWGPMGVERTFAEDSVC